MPWIKKGPGIAGPFLCAQLGDPYGLDCLTLPETHLPNALDLLVFGVPYFSLKAAGSPFRSVQQDFAALIVVSTRAAAAAFAVMETQLPKAFRCFGPVPYVTANAVGSGERSLRLTACVGIALFGQEFDVGPEAVLVNADIAMYEAKEAGRDPSRLTATNQLAIYVGRNREETEKDMRQWLSTEWDTAAWSESTIEHAIHGSAEQCIEQLRAHVKTGVNRIILIPYRYQPAQVERIAKEVMAKL